MADRADKVIVVFDASAFVSAALKPESTPEQALLAAVAEPNRLVLSQEVEDEYREVIFRRKFDRYVSRDRRRFVLELVLIAALRVEPKKPIRECSDPKDDKYLSLAAEAGASAIVTGDVRHLLTMHPWRGIPIVSPADFLALLSRPGLH